MATISLKALQIDTIIGIYDHELNKPQPLLFDVELEADISKAADSDDIHDALDYHAVAKHIESLVEKSDKKLLEGLLVSIADDLLETFSKIQSMSITVRKPQAIPNAEHAAITHTASR